MDHGPLHSGTCGPSSGGGPNVSAPRFEADRHLGEARQQMGGQTAVISFLFVLFWKPLLQVSAICGAAYAIAGDPFFPGWGVWSPIASYAIALGCGFLNGATGLPKSIYFSMLAYAAGNAWMFGGAGVAGVEIPLFALAAVLMLIGKFAYPLHGSFNDQGDFKKSFFSSTAMYFIGPITAGVFLFFAHKTPPKAHVDKIADKAAYDSSVVAYKMMGKPQISLTDGTIEWHNGGGQPLMLKASFPSNPATEVEMDDAGYAYVGLKDGSIILIGVQSIPPVDLKKDPSSAKISVPPGVDSQWKYDSETRQGASKLVLPSKLPNIAYAYALCMEMANDKLLTAVMILPRDKIAALERRGEDGSAEFYQGGIDGREAQDNLQKVFDGLRRPWRK